MCLMHKSEEYGMILLRQKDKQNESKVLNFASKLARHFPFPTREILEGLNELLDNEVIYIEGDNLCQKRMISDNTLSIKRAEAGKKGGDLLRQKLKQMPKQKDEQTLNMNMNMKIDNKEEDKKEEILSIDKPEEKEIHLIQIFIKENLGNVRKLNQQLTEEEVRKLLQNYTEEEIKEILQAMDNYAPLQKKYISVYKTALNWLKLRKDKQQNHGTKSNRLSTVGTDFSKPL